jgi:parvulin-like peptidyl-prolyl isomerase
MRKKIIIAVALLLFCVSFKLSARQAWATSVIDKIAAVVNEDVITESELQESMLPFIADYRVRYGEQAMEQKINEARQDALNRLIEEKLIFQEAQKRKVTVEDYEIQQRLQEVKQRFDSDEAFYEAINSSGVTIARLKGKYKEQIMMRKMINGVISARVSISPTQVAAYYYGNIKDFFAPDMARFKVLYIKPAGQETLGNARRLAEDIKEKIAQGEDFDMLVKQYSQGPNIDKGGDMGYMPAGSAIPEIEDAISQLNPGDISDILEIKTGFYIIMVVDKKQAGAVPIADVSDIIKERLFQRESELTLREFVGKLKEDAYIRIN